jgi:hypothetical protein
VAWGLIYADHPTHMCYEATPAGTPNHAIVAAGDSGWWIFDMGRDIRVKRVDLIKAFVELRDRLDLITEALRFLTMGTP